MIISPQLTSAQRVYLDFLRAAAAFAVLFGHASVAFLQGGALEKMNIQIGAVPVFFLISGFLISLSVFQKRGSRQYGFGAYFIDRFCRIYCAYLPALVFAAIVDWLIVDAGTYSWKDHFNTETWAGNLLMLQDFPLFQIARRLGVPDNPWFVSSFGSAGPFWTISIEWWIYMLFGAVFFFCLRAEKPLKLWQKMLIGFLAIEPAYHFVGGPDRCLTMLWVIGMGASLFFLHLPRFAASWTITERQWRHLCLTVCVAFLLALVAHGYANRYHQQAPGIYGPVDAGITEFQSGFYLAVALFAILFACGTVYSVPKFLEKFMGFIAGYSYSLYLTHSTVFAYLGAQATAPNSPKSFWLALGAANVVAIFFWWFFERHYHALATYLKNRRVYESRQQALAK